MFDAVVQKADGLAVQVELLVVLLFHVGAPSQFCPDSGRLYLAKSLLRARMDQASNLPFIYMTRKGGQRTTVQAVNWVGSAAL